MTHYTRRSQRVGFTVVFATVLAFFQAGCYGSTGILVSAASSLTNVLTKIATAYEQQGGEHVTLNLAGSHTLAQQIRAGARVDLFISADESQLNVIADAIELSTRVDLLSNQLVLIVPDDRSRIFQSAHDLLDSSIRRIALGDPRAVPVGIYARNYLEKVGIWAEIAKKVVPTGNVRLALAAVENGTVDAAIVYRTDLLIARRALIAFAVPPNDGPQIVYPAAIVRGGRNTNGGRQFLAYLQGEEATKYFQQAGFVPLQAIERKLP
jgi:molybdate transport system substrate-binding protein